MSFKTQMCSNTVTSFSNSSGDGGGDESCLICRASSSSKSKVSIDNVNCSQIETSVLSQNLDVYFILKKVLQFTSQQLQNYLVYCPELGAWVKICDNCNRNYVENCKKVFDEMINIQRKFEYTKAVLINAIKESVEAEERELLNNDNGNGDQCCILDICKEIRQYVKKRTYTHCNVNPFTRGDLMAQEKLQVLQAKCVNALSSIDTDITHLQEKLQLSEVLCILERELKEEPRSPDMVETGEDEEAFDINLKSDNLLEEDRNFREENGSDQNNSDDDWATNNLSEPEDEDDEVDEPPSKIRKYIKNESGSLTTTKPMESSKRGRRRPPKKIKISTSSSTTVKRKYTKRIKLKQMEKPKRRRGRPRKKSPSPYSPSSATAESTTQQLVKCDQCSKTCKTETQLQKHLLRTHKMNLYECSECEYKTNNKRNLGKHMICHNNVAVTCPICQLVLTSELGLKHHMLRLHNSNREKFQCDHCGQVYADKIGLLNHMGSKHGLKDHLRFVCSFEGCRKAYHKKSQLVEHQLIHKNTPTYKCEICGAEYKTTKSYRRHLDHHKFGEPKPFACDLCPSRYARKDNLLAHMRKHNSANILEGAEGGAASKKMTREQRGAKCSECDLLFTTPKLLCMHVEKMHSDGKTEKHEESSSEVIAL